MAILVTGGAGYIGSHTVVELQNAGYDSDRIILRGYERNHIFAGFSTIHDVPGNGILQF